MVRMYIDYIIEYMALWHYGASVREGAEWWAVSPGPTGNELLLKCVGRSHKLIAFSAGRAHVVSRAIRIYHVRKWAG